MLITRRITRWDDSYLSIYTVRSDLRTTAYPASPPSRCLYLKSITFWSANLLVWLDLRRSSEDGSTCGAICPLKWRHVQLNYIYIYMCVYGRGERPNHASLSLSLHLCLTLPSMPIRCPKSSPVRSWLDWLLQLHNHVREDPQSKHGWKIMPHLICISFTLHKSKDWSQLTPDEFG